MAFGRSSSLPSLLLLGLLLLSSVLNGPAGGCMMMAMAEDDYYCHYLDGACTSKEDCTRQCAAQDYDGGAICVPNPFGRWKRCCCIIY